MNTLNVYFSMNNMCCMKPVSIILIKCCDFNSSGAHPAWYQQTMKLKAEAEISREGGKLEIPNTGVKLDVPPNAFEHDVDHFLIQMKIILPGVFDEPATSFTSNTSTVVEVLPNNLRLKEAVSLTIPHCLELEADRKDGSYTAKIFISHHEIGTVHLKLDILLSDILLST